MTKPVPKLVDSKHYHLWTDALHARALAQQAHNKWDRGTYIRWTITTAWSAFEVACMDALGCGRIGDRFKERVDDELKEKYPQTKLDWGKGVWHDVLKVQKRRNAFIHVAVTQDQLFPDIVEAFEVVNVLRTAIRDLYARVGKAVPTWVDDDYDRGWDTGSRSSVNLTNRHNGADEDDPATIRVAYVYKDREHIADIYPPGTNLTTLFDDLLTSMRVPISSIRVYQGSQLLEERSITMRGTE